MTAPRIPPANIYAGLSLDRCAEARDDPARLAALRSHPQSRLLLLSEGRPAAVLGGGDAAGAPDASGRLAWHPLSALLDGLHPDGALDLGLLAVDADGAGLFAAELGPDAAPPPIPGAAYCALRALGIAVGADDAALACLARGLSLWRTKTKFCCVCGSPLSVQQAGWSLRCVDPACGHIAYPRIDPAVILLAHDGGDRCLLARKQEWPPGFMALLAGFVEPGESLEDAVRREAREEAGIEIGPVTYHSSQPWPFPGSLMVGFFAQAIGGEARADGVEIEAVRWFSRDELRHGPGEGASWPAPDSLALRLIEAWRAGAA